MNIPMQIAVLLCLVGILRELRLIRKRMGGTLKFFPWHDK